MYVIVYAYTNKMECILMEINESLILKFHCIHALNDSTLLGIKMTATHFLVS